MHYSYIYALFIDRDLLYRGAFKGGLTEFYLMYITMNKLHGNSKLMFQ